MRLRCLSQMHHQFVAVGARHLQIGDDQITTMLQGNLEGLEPISGQAHPISSFLQHPAHKFTDADGVVCKDHNFFLTNVLNGCRWNVSGSNCCGSRRKNSRCSRVRHQRTGFDRLASNEAAHVNEQDQAAIGSDRSSGKELDVAEIFAQVLNDDFVFANDLVNEHADRASGNADEHQMTEAVYRFTLRKSKLRIEADYFGH